MLPFWCGVPAAVKEGLRARRFYVCYGGEQEVKGQENLIPFDQRSEDERRAIARIGGIESGKTRRAQKTMRDCANFLLALPVKELKKRKRLASIGVDPDSADQKLVVVAALIAAAADGDVAAIRELRSLLGEDRDTGDAEMLARARELLGGVDSVI